MLGRLVSPGETVLDIGANVRRYTLRLWELFWAGQIGFRVSLRLRHIRLWIISATVAYFIVVYSLLHEIAWYRVPLLPLLILLGVW